SADEAVALANDSDFALSASVWTGNAAKGREIALRIRAGSVMINDVASYYGISEAPHGGSRSSGWGRSHSRFGLLEMVQVKYVDVDLLPRTPKSWWFGYNEGLAAAADRFVDFLFAPRWTRRMGALASTRGALGTVFRGHRIFRVNFPPGGKQIGPPKPPPAAPPPPPPPAGAAAPAAAPAAPAPTA